MARRPKRLSAQVKSMAANSRIKNSPENKALFLEGLRAGMSVRKAAEAISCGRRTVFDWRDADEQFATAWEDAMQDGIDNLEDEAYRRAVKGTKKPIFHQGAVCGHVREYSDTLLTLMLKGKRAGTYNTDRVEHTGAGGGPVDHKITVEFVSAPKRKKGDD